MSRSFVARRQLEISGSCQRPTCCGAKSRAPKMTRTTKLLGELIALPSVNPAFLPARHPHAGEGRVAEFLAAVGVKAGLDVEFLKALPHRPNLLLRLTTSSKPTRRILLAPHLDTVNIVDQSQLKPACRNGRMYGRGAADTK